MFKITVEHLFVKWFDLVQELNSSFYFIFDLKKLKYYKQIQMKNKSQYIPEIFIFFSQLWLTRLSEILFQLWMI